MHTQKKRTRVVITPDGTKMKLCPGDNCDVFLPLYQFGSNSNMPDGLDTYCVECNNKKRREKEARRFRTSMSYTPFMGSTSPNNTQMSTVGYGNVMRRDVLQRLEDSIDEASRTLSIPDFPLTAETLYDKLFSGRRLLCDRTGEHLTPGCFLDHHAIHFMIEDGRLNAKCNQCSVP